jgi:hypothetical protein
MSDVTVAPQGSAPPAAPAAPANEVPINQNQTSSPNPIGSQAPPAPTGDIKGSEHRPQSRREAITAAFERANAPKAAPERHAPKPAPKAAEAKPGHNQPPEATEKFDLKKRPSEQTGQIERRQDQPRDQGRFTARPTPGAPTASPGNAPGAAAAARPVPQLPAHAPFNQPVQRMSEQAKRDWPATPETVRGDIHRMHQEFAKAAQYYKADQEAMKPIRRFHEMAQQHGTTLEAALTNYTSMEQKLRADPIGGLDVIIHNLGLKSNDGQPIGLRDIAYHVLSQSPDQLRAIQQGNTQEAAARQIGALHQQVAGLQDALQRMQYNQQHTYTRSAVDQFATTHPRFDELGPLIEQELKFGFDLETAYRRADMLRPATHAAQTRTTTAQTRPPADKSIHGSPGASASAATSRRPREASRSPRDAVENAIRRLNGSL